MRQHTFSRRNLELTITETDAGIVVSHPWTFEDAAREILRLAARVTELEAEVGSWRRVSERLEGERLRLAAVAAPLLPLFREREKDWERMNGGRKTAAGRERRPLPMPETITLTAEFPVEALRAMIKE